MTIPIELTPMQVHGRADRVRELFDPLEVDGLVVTDLSNVSWLTGFTGSNAAVVVAQDALTLFTDGRYRDQAPEQLQRAGVDAQVEIGADVINGAIEAAAPLLRLGLEADTISWAAQQQFADARTASLVAVSGALVELRAVKDSGELHRIRSAAQITDATLAEVRAMLGARPTEREVALALDHGMRSRGATAAAYETIVAAGPNGALPHARPTDRVIDAGDLVVIDVGALVDGYRSDMTRTFVIGEPTPDQQRHLDVVQESQAAGAAAVRGGVPVNVVDKACRDVIAEAGWAERFTHGTGHGVGIDIHERPRVNSRSTDILETGMVVTVEPGVYLPGVGGVRWEDLLHVTNDGAEVLSGSPKAPLVP